MIQVPPLQHTVPALPDVKPSMLETATVLPTEPRTMSARTALRYFLLHALPSPFHYSFQCSQQGSFILLNVYAK